MYSAPTTCQILGYGLRTPLQLNMVLGFNTFIVFSDWLTLNSISFQREFLTTQWVKQKWRCKTRKEEDQTCYPRKLMYTLCVTQAFKLALSFLGVVTKYRVIWSCFLKGEWILVTMEARYKCFPSEQIPAKTWMSCKLLFPDPKPQWLL